MMQVQVYITFWFPWNLLEHASFDVLCNKHNVPNLILRYYCGRYSYSFLPFRNRIRMYPAFVNCTTIDWFSEWPQDALLEVAEKYLENMDLGDDEVTYNVPC